MRTGLTNPVDLAALVAGAVVIGGGLHTYQVMRQPLPRITSVEPSSVRKDKAAWLTLTGSNFRYARVAMVTNRLLVPLREVTDDRLQAYFDPQALDLMPDRYDMRVLNGWGRGHVLLNAITVMPSHPPPRPAARLPSHVLLDAITVMPSHPPPRPAAGLLSTETTPRSRQPTPTSQSQPVRSDTPTVWVVIEGMVEEASVAPRIHAGDVEYDVEGRPVARVLWVEPTCLMLTLRHEYQREGTYYYQGRPLAAGRNIVFTTRRYRANVEVIGNARASDEGVGVEVHLGVKPDGVGLVEQLRPGEEVLNSHREAVGHVVEGFAGASMYPGDFSALVRVRLRAQVDKGALWVEDAKDPTLKELRYGRRLLLATSKGHIQGVVVRVPNRVCAAKEER